MSLFKRVLTGQGAQLPGIYAQGSGYIGNHIPAVIATDAALTLTTAQLAGGLVQFTGFSAGRAVTVPTAANLLLAAPDMDIGDSFSVIASVTTAFAATWTANTGVTITGRTTLPASTTSQLITVTRTGAATFTWHAS
jgi:hypothetical protein